MRKLCTRGSTALTALVVVLGAWLILAPAQIGGGTRYAVVEGSSMEPGLSRGDLVLVRPDSSPAVGDVVLYHDPAMGVRIFHRVVRVEDGRLVLRGDANGFVDDARVRPSDVIGSFWFAVPWVGSALLWLQQPVHAALLAFFLTIFALSGYSAPRRKVTEEAGSK
jgi:signal peptidase I